MNWRTVGVLTPVIALLVAVGAIELLPRYGFPVALVGMLLVFTGGAALTHRMRRAG